MNKPHLRVTKNEELVFQHMAYRKLERQLRGTYKNEKPWTLLWTFLTLLLLFGLVAPNFVKNEDAKKSFDIKINIRDLGFLSLMAIVCIIILVYTLTRVVVVVRWSLYWLLATLSILYLWKRQINLFSNDTPAILLIGFGILEFLTFFFYVLLNFIYPRFVESTFFRKNVGVTWWFGLKLKSHWTLTYSPSSWFEGRRSCTYRGETDADGLPHGFGNWLDDSFHGELLSGMWEHGVPVGPFRSREFGSGFAFESLRIGFAHCSDDSFTSRMYFPSQNRLPTIGVASVECSVAGGFFSHLPRAVIREGPYCLASIINDEESIMGGGSIGASLYPDVTPHRPFRYVSDIIPHIKVLYTEHPSSSLIITASRGRGVLVSGHTFAASKMEPNQLIIDVIRDENNYEGINTDEDDTTPLPSIDINPTPATDAPGSSLVLAEDNEEEEIIEQPLIKRVSFTDTFDEGEYHTPLMENPIPLEQDDDPYLFFNLDHIPAATFHNQLLQQQQYLLHRPHSNVFQSSRLLVSQGLQISTQEQHAPSSVSAQSQVLSGPHLRVRDWKSTVDGHIEALIFFPGFNASLEHSLQRLGQFMAMGRFPPHIKPIVFSWPCAREATYLWAVETATSEKTHQALAALLRGLRDSGVTDIHFLVHSLGAQVVCSSLRDDEKTRSRSAVSKLFSEVSQTNISNLLRLRTLTLLNPDTPLSSFIREDFKHMRKICDHITVVGDRKDGALDWSELGNGLVRTLKGLKEIFFQNKQNTTPKNACGRCGDRDSCCFRKPFALCCQSCIDDCCLPYRHGVDRLFSRVLTVGKNIFSLYVRPSNEEDDISARERLTTWMRSKRNSEIHHDDHSFLSDDVDQSPQFLRRKRKWLDVDVIDTSSMETNVHQLRHAYFDLNKILVEDLHELIVTGKRAAERSLLLHREGNIFSFCQAPACVVNQ